VHVRYNQGYHTVLICKICPLYEGAFLENFILLTFKKCVYFGLVSLFYLIVSILGLCIYCIYFGLVSLFILLLETASSCGKLA